jgi:hypothetical protein
VARRDRWRTTLWVLLVAAAALALAVYLYGGTFPEGSPARDATAYATLALGAAAALLAVLLARTARRG